MEVFQTKINQQEWSSNTIRETGPKGNWSSGSCASSITTGSIVAVYGILSMNADAIADTQRSNRITTITLFSSDAVAIILHIKSAILSINPIYSSPWIIINKPAKKIIVVHSTESNCSSTLWWEVTRNISNALAIAIVVTGEDMQSVRKKLKSQILISFQISSEVLYLLYRT